MRKFTLILICLVLISTLTGFMDSDSVLQTEGEVYNKEFIEAQVITEQKSTSNGRDYLVEVSYPARYIIYVKYKELYTKEDLYVTYAFYVSENMFEQTNIGDKYLYNPVKDSLHLVGVIEKEVEE